MDDEQRKTIGRRLQEIRGARDQRTFAEAVDSVQQTISKYERGEIPRSWLFLARLSGEEGVDLNRLLLGEAQRGQAPESGPEARDGNGNGSPAVRPAGLGRADRTEFSGSLRN